MSKNTAKIEIDSCQNCPHFERERYYTEDSWEKAYNWFCHKNKEKREIQGYVEWNEVRGISIPKWCPLNCNKGKVDPDKVIKTKPMMVKEGHSTIYKSDTKSFLRMINNGWLHNPKGSIDKVYRSINELIRNKENLKRIEIFHVPHVIEFFKGCTSGGIEIVPIGPSTICSGVNVIVNIDYSQLSDSEYYELLKTIKKNE